jgi:hypothetical protein
MAGYDPTGDADARILTATSTNLRVTKDIGDGAGGDSDGDTSDANEDIRFAINGNGALGREAGGAGGLQPIAENIDQLIFEYYMENDTWTSNPADLTKIRAIKISILGHSARQTAGTVDSSTFDPPLESATVHWKPATPGRFYWRMVSLVVQCRNIQIKSS